MTFRSAIIVAAVLVSACIAGAQYIIHRETPSSIRIAGLDRIMSDARRAAITENNPDIEFEMVKAYIKDYVDGTRQNTSQLIDFDSPDRFKRWLGTVAERMGKDKSELITAILEAIEPNRCPELTGETHSDYDYFRKRAINEMRTRISGEHDDEVETPMPPVQFQPMPAATPEQIPDIRTPTPRSTRTRANNGVTSISIEFVPARSQPVDTP